MVRTILSHIIAHVMSAHRKKSLSVLCPDFIEDKIKYRVQYFDLEVDTDPDKSYIITSTWCLILMKTLKVSKEHKIWDKLLWKWN